MAVVNFCGFETGDFAECESTAGTLSVQGTTVRTGGYALQVNPVTTASGYARVKGLAADGSVADASVANSYIRFYFQYATKPATNSERVLLVWATAAAYKLDIRLNSAGKILVYNRFVSLIGTSTTTLSSGTWYRVEVLCGTGTSASWAMKINGTTELSGTADLHTSNAIYLDFGKNGDQFGQSLDVFFDDITWDDAAYPGPGAIQVMQPNADGFYTDWTASAGNRYQCVDELPHTSDTDYVTTSTSLFNYTAALESAASAGVKTSPRAVKSLAVVRDEGGASAVQVRLRSNTTDNDTTSSDPGAAYVLRAKLHATDPATSAAWLLSALDSIEVGVEANAAVAHRCTLACAMVEYNDSPTGAFSYANPTTGTVTATGGASSSTVGGY